VNNRLNVTFAPLSRNAFFLYNDFYTSDFPKGQLMVNENKGFFENTILILDDNVRFLESVKRRLEKGGFNHVLMTIDADTASTMVEMLSPRVVLIDIHLGEDKESGLEFVKFVHNSHHNSLPVVLSSDTSQEQFFNAARAGAVDFLVKGTHLKIDKEVKRLLQGERGATKERNRSEIISDLGYLRSYGLSKKEISVLIEYSVDFPRISVLAERIGQRPAQLRKVFSRIYKKLELENTGQLAHILTICSLFEQDSSLNG
jgi:ActR/RegA family two-component response regulator